MRTIKYQNKIRWRKTKIPSGVFHNITVKQRGILNDSRDDNTASFFRYLPQLIPNKTSLDQDKQVSSRFRYHLFIYLCKA